MATIETKYGIGDVVFHATTETAKMRRDCPDCLGSKKWAVTSPAGGQYSIACPRCATSYMSDRDLSLEYAQFTASARKLTIGSIRHDTHNHGDGAKTEYMCSETGIGNGSIYREDDLFATEAEARAVAAIKAAERNKDTDWIAKLYNKTLEISDYQLDAAGIHAAKEMKSRWASLAWNVNGLFDEIAEADDKDAILELVDDYKRYNMERDIAAVRDALKADAA